MQPIDSNNANSALSPAKPTQTPSSQPALLFSPPPADSENHSAHSDAPIKRLYFNDEPQSPTPIPDTEQATTLDDDHSKQASSSKFSRLIASTVNTADVELIASRPTRQRKSILPTKSSSVAIEDDADPDISSSFEPNIDPEPAVIESKENLRTASISVTSTTTDAASSASLPSKSKKSNSKPSGLSKSSKSQTGQASSKRESPQRKSHRSKPSQAPSSVATLALSSLSAEQEQSRSPVQSIPDESAPDDSINITADSVADPDASVIVDEVDSSSEMSSSVASPSPIKRKAKKTIKDAKEAKPKPKSSSQSKAPTQQKPKSKSKSQIDEAEEDASLARKKRRETVSYYWIDQLVG